MEFTALNGSEISKIELTDTGILFTTDLYDIEANITIDGIESIFKNGELVEINGLLEEKLQSLCGISNINHVNNRNKIRSVDLEVISFEDDTFSEAIIVTDNDTFRFVGNMKATVLNMEDFEHLISENFENDEDCDCYCDDDFGCVDCNEDCNEDCDCD